MTERAKLKSDGAFGELNMPYKGKAKYSDTETFLCNQGKEY